MKPEYDKMRELTQVIGKFLMENFMGEDIIEIQAALTGSYFNIMKTICEMRGHVDEQTAQRQTCLMLNDLSKKMLADMPQPKADA